MSGRLRCFGVPADVEHGRVIAQTHLGVVECGSDQAADDFLRRSAGEVFAGEQVAQSLYAESASVGIAGLGDAVGVEQDAIAWLEGYFTEGSDDWPQSSPARSAHQARCQRRAESSRGAR